MQLEIGCPFSLQIIINVLPVPTVKFNKKWHDRCSDVVIGLSILFSLIRRSKSARTLLLSDVVIRVLLIYEGWLKSFKTDFFIQNQLTLQALQFFLFQSSVLHIEYTFTAFYKRFKHVK